MLHKVWVLWRDRKGGRGAKGRRGSKQSRRRRKNSGRRKDVDGGMALPNPHKGPGKVLFPITPQQSTKKTMEKFLSSSAALLLLAGFVGAVLTDKAQTEGYSLSTSTTITNTTTTSTSVTTGPATVQDANTTAPTMPAITTTTGGKQSHSGSGRGAEQGKEEKEKSREDDKPGKRAESCCWLKLIVFIAQYFFSLNMCIESRKSSLGCFIRHVKNHCQTSDQSDADLSQLFEMLAIPDQPRGNSDWFALPVLESVCSW